MSTGSEAPYPVGANIPVVSGEMLLLFSHSVMLDSAAPWTAAYQAPLSFTISQSLLRFMSIESVMPSNHLILCHSLLFLPSIFASVRVFSSESGLHIRCSEYWSFSFSISPSNDYSGLISFRIEWFDLFAIQGTLKSLLHNLEASIQRHSAFLMAQLSHLYMTTGETPKSKIMTSDPITSWQTDGETVETVIDFIFFGLQNHCSW